ncbi:MAG: hypothetical protein KC800_30460 [Candidatus Eremiobacteraeota bacterium]|nr:hypothetical protein [Candidatus Eremiobacteraeota bacterium]
MNTLRKLWLTVLCAAVLTAVLPAQADVTWDSVKNKIKSNKNYNLTYDYNGPSGIFTFDYDYNDGSIKTEIKNSKSDPTRKGTVIIYKKGAKQVIASTGSGTIARNLDHKDVVGRPFHVSIWEMILGQVGGTPKAYDFKGGKKFVFPGGYTIWADKDSNIVKTERKDGTTPETREFSNIQWN